MERIFDCSPALINLLCLFTVAGGRDLPLPRQLILGIGRIPVLEYWDSNYQNVFTGLLYLPEKEAGLFPLKCL